MTKEEIEIRVISYIQNSLDGLEVENPKVDFKTEWYNLTEELDRYEFLKDTSAIANTIGKEGFIIIGFNVKTKGFNDSYVSDSKLNDESQINGIITKFSSTPYYVNCYDIKYEDHQISVIYIPASYSAPHVLKSYKSKKGKEDEHRIFIRRGTSSKIATKDDLENIYFYRGAHVPDYAFDLYLPMAGIHISLSRPQKHLLAGVIIENFGRKPISICEIFLKIKYKDDQVLNFKSYVNDDTRDGNKHIDVNNLIVQSNMIQKWPIIRFQFVGDIKYEDEIPFFEKKSNISEITAEVNFVNGKSFNKMIEF